MQSRFSYLAAAFTFLMQFALVAEETNKSSEINIYSVSNRLELRQQLRNMTPEERKAKVEELRAQWRTNATRLTSEQREAHLKALKEKRTNETNAPAPRVPIKAMTLNDKLAELRAKKADGKITPKEEDLLKRLETRSTNVPPRTVITNQHPSIQKTNGGKPKIPEQK